MQFRDLRRQYERLRLEIDKVMTEVVESSRFISGPQVKELEAELADYVGVKHCISCANGTDAISIALLAHGVGEMSGGSRTDAVFVPDFTFFSSGECPGTVGATPVFVDVRKDTYNIDAASLEKEVEQVVCEGRLTPKAVVAVDLFGQPFDLDAVREICDRYGMILLEDAAQGFGGSYSGRRACSLGDISTTSFFPAKPLGCYGDGGAVFTDDDEVASLCRSIAVHGKDMQHPDDPNAKYNNARLGMNSRLDTLQAAILQVKFKAFQEFELEEINHIAGLYNECLGDIKGLALPKILDICYSSWAQYTVQLPAGADRAVIQGRLKEDGIPTNIYYIKPMHKQGAFAGTRSAIAECPNTELLCESVLCLPIHPYMTDEEVKMVSGKLGDALRG